MRYHVELYPLDPGDGSTVEGCCDTVYIHLLYIAFQDQRHLFSLRQTAGEVELIVAGIKSQLIPHKQQAVARIAQLSIAEAVAVAETIFVERKDLQFVVMEITVEPAPLRTVATLVHVVPNAVHQRAETKVGKMVIEHEFQIFVDAV